MTLLNYLLDEQKGNIEFPHGIKSVLTLSWKQLLLNKLYIFIAGGIGSLMTVLTFFNKYYNWTLTDSVGIGVIAISIIILIIFLILFSKIKDLRQ
ncbi:MAG: hypothetical protein IPM96_04520 [Ignavibacteria bacterium]|nr:hypothetical protein [Ignavibacteria bacterium]